MTDKEILIDTIDNFKAFCGEDKFKTILADPPWQFQNRTGKVAPEHKRLNRYPTLSLEAIKAIPVDDVAEEKSHLYLWVPNALLPEGLKRRRPGRQRRGFLFPQCDRTAALWN